MLTEADKYDFNETLHFCFYPMKNGFVSKFDGGSLVINGKLAGIKIHNKPHTNNSLYSKTTNFEEFLNQFIGREEITTTSTEVHVCPELSEMLEKMKKLFQVLFDRLFGTFDEPGKRSGLLRTKTSDRISTRTEDFQSDSESILEFEFSVRPGMPENGSKDLVIEHFSKPYFYLKITNERLYLRVERDPSLTDPQFWFYPLKAIVTHTSWDGEILEKPVDFIPIELLNIIATTLYMYTFNFFPSFTDSIYVPTLIDPSKSLYYNINIHLNLNLIF